MFSLNHLIDTDRTTFVPAPLPEESNRGAFLQIDDDEPTPEPVAVAEPEPVAEPIGSTRTAFGIEVLDRALTGPGATARACDRFGHAEEYRKEPALNPVSGEPIRKAFFVMDKLDRVVWPSTVGTKYKCVQNKVAFGVLESLLGPEEMTIKKGGTWKGLGVPWLYAEHAKKMKAPNGELIESGCLFQNPQGGLGCMTAHFTDVNPACSNQFGSIVSGSKHSFKIPHTKSANARIAKMRDALSQAGAHRQEVLDYLFRMKDLKMTRKAIVEVGKLSLGIDLKAAAHEIKTRAGNRLEKFLEIYLKGDAASPGDFYGGVQVITNWRSNEFSKVTGLEGLATTNSGLWQDSALKHLNAYAEKADKHVQVYVGR